MSAALRSHMIGFTFLLPFLGMLVVHRILDLSDNISAAPDLGQRSAPVYNYVTAYAFGLGVTLYFAHAVVNAPRSKAWFIAKLVFLATFWTVLLMLL